jgi:transposase-like protein
MSSLRWARPFSLSVTRVKETTWAQLGDVVDKLTQAGFVDVATSLLDAADDVLVFTSLPPEHWPKIRANNPQERLNKEIWRHRSETGHRRGGGLTDSTSRRHSTDTST